MPDPLNRTQLFDHTATGVSGGFGSVPQRPRSPEDPGASATRPPAFLREVRIGDRVGMAVLARDSASASGEQALSAGLVLSSRDDLQMARIAASPVPTQVVDLSPLRDRSHEQFPDDAVDIEDGLVATSGLAHLPVAVVVDRAVPFPAVAGGVDAMPEAVLNRPALVSGHGPIIHVVA